MKLERAIFASGCFWGVQTFYNQINGVAKTTVGYCGGSAKKPTYEQVSTGRTGHAESIEVLFDPKKISYEELVKFFFETHDPTQIGGQGPDIGNQYRSVIFYINDKQKQVAIEIIDLLKDRGYNISTEVKKATKFWPAEDYHQNYYDKVGGVPYCRAYRKLF